MMLVCGKHCHHTTNQQSRHRSTDTLSCPSQDSETTNEVLQTSASVECQTDEVIVMSKEEYEEIVDKAARNIDIR